MYIEWPIHRELVTKQGWQSENAIVIIDICSDGHIVYSIMNVMLAYYHVILDQAFAISLH